MTSSGAFSQVYDQHPLFGPNALRTVHPSYDFADLLPANAAQLPAGFSGHIGGMAFLPNGRLAIADFPDPSFQPWRGSVWVLGGVLTGIQSQVTYHLFANNLYAPTGLTVVGGQIYVIDANTLKLLTGNDSTGTAVVTDITRSWHQGGGQPAIADLKYLNGYFYTSIGNSGGLSVDGASIAMGTAKIAANGNVQMLCTGYRNPGGAGINTQGDIFATDNQGEWLPSSKIINVVPGRYYGYGGLVSNGKTWSPPAVWIPEGMINAPAGDASTWAAGMSPATLLSIDTGVFANQFLMGDIRYGNVDRIFLEKVQNEYQGALFHFSGGFRAGIYRMAWGPDGALYLGGMGGSGYTWSWYDSRVDDDWALHRMKPNGRATFEMIAARAMAGGFELQFTQPLGINAGAVGNFRVQSWIYQPTGSYGGPQVNMTTLAVQSTQMSTDKTRLFLAIAGLQANHVVHIALDSNSVVSSLGAKPWTFETWYTLNNLSTAVATNPELPSARPGRFQAKATSNGGILIESETAGRYQIRDARGAVLEEGMLDARQSRESIHRYKAGLYFVSLHGRQAIKVICF